MGHYCKQKDGDDERRILLVGLDYAFLKKGDGIDGEAPEFGEVTALVMKDQRSKCVFAVPVPQKGIDPEEYLALKCDQ